MERSEEKFIWDIVTEIYESHGSDVDDISIHKHEEFGDQFYKVYCSKGYCFELSKIEADEDQFDNVEYGFVYSYSEPWDGFKKAGINKAIEILNIYAGL
jgi:hypothetical protein